MCGGVLWFGADRSSAEGRSHDCKEVRKTSGTELCYLPSSHMQGQELVSSSQASHHMQEITTAAPLHKMFLVICLDILQVLL